MAEAGNEVMKGREENSDSNPCLTTAVRSIEHIATHDINDTGLLGVSHSVPTSKNDTKTGVFVGVALPYETLFERTKSPPTVISGP